METVRKWTKREETLVHCDKKVQSVLEKDVQF